MIVNTIVHVVSKLVALSPKHGRHAQGVTHGTFDALFLGERNQHREPYGTQLMDAQLDGIDPSGGFVGPRPNIPNVESDEMHGPVLYLCRSFFPDSGGDGRFRGGRAAGLAFTPYGVERLRCALTTQGVESPVSRGQFGGYPGVCNRHTVVRGTRVMDLITRGEVVEEELPRGIRVHDDLDLVEYLCPDCGTLHAVEVKRRDERLVQDIKLAATAFAALTEGAV